MKSYFYQYAIFLIALLCFTSLINLLVDPYGIFNLIEITGLNRNKTRKFSTPTAWAKTTANILSQNKYDTIFFGSSRVHLGLNPKFIKNICSAYNMAFSSADYRDFKIFKSLLDTSKSIKNIVWGIDFGCDWSRKLINYPTNLAQKLNLPNLLSEMILRDSMITIFHNVCNIKQKRNFYPNGFLKLSDQAILVPHQKKLCEITDHLKKYKRIIDGKEIKFIKLLIDTCNKKKINLYIFISPVHSDMFDILMGYEKGDPYKSWVRQLTCTVNNMNSESCNRENKVELWDFSGYNSITKDSSVETNMRWYYEASHYRESVGNMILEKMLIPNTNRSERPDDFGKKLTPNNIQQHFNRMYKKN